MTTTRTDRDLEYFTGPMQPSYHSPGCRSIAQMLDDYGIPFFYKRPTLIRNRDGREVLWPDFTLPSYNYMVIQYIEKNCRFVATDHTHLYRDNVITALCLHPCDLAMSGWQQRLYERLEQMCDHPLEYLGLNPLTEGS